MAVLHARRDHEIQHADVVLAAEAARQTQHLAEQVAVALAVDEDEAAALHQRVAEEREDRGGLAGAGRAGDRNVLARVLGRDPKLLVQDRPAEENVGARDTRPPGARLRAAVIAAPGRARQPDGQPGPSGQHPQRVEGGPGHGEVDHRRLDEGHAGGGGQNGRAAGPAQRLG